MRHCRPPPRVALNVLAAGVDILLLGRVDPALGGPAYTGCSTQAQWPASRLLIPWSMPAGVGTVALLVPCLVVITVTAVVWGARGARDRR